MFASYPMQQQQQPMSGMPMALVYPQSYYPNPALPYPIQGYGGMFGAYGNAPVMMAGPAGAPQQPMGMYMPHPVAPMYFVMDPAAHSATATATPTCCAAAFDCSSTRSDAKLPHSGSRTSLSTQSNSSGGESASLLSNSVTTAPMRARPQHDVGTWGFALVDQLHPSLQRIPVPPSCLSEPTMGISLYDNDVTMSSTRPCKSSVCLLHAQGLGCADGARCRCFHVSRSYLQQCRSTTEPLCCAMHNCYYSQEMLASKCAPHLMGRRFVLSLDDASRFPQDGEKPYLIDLSLLHLSLTVGLETVPFVDGAYVISWKKHVCHLNLDGRCKWTKDCGHIHMCRKLIKVLQDAESLAVLKALQAKDTPKDAADLYKDIILSEPTLRYVRSPAVCPLVASLIAAKDVESLKALAKAKCALRPEQSAALQQLGIQVSSTDGASRATSPVSPKLAGLFAPTHC